jgi:hypothetical protein
MAPRHAARRDDIGEILDRLRRTMHRVRNAGNADLHRSGLRIASKIRRADDLTTARSLEADYLRDIKKAYEGAGPFAIALTPATVNADAYDESGDYYTYKDDSIDLTDEMKDKVSDIADAYHEATGETLTVTDGSRDADDQAAAMFTKLENGDDLSHLYSNQDALHEIQDAYDEALNRGASDDEIRAAMAAVIEQQIQDDVYISRHLTDNAFDVRSREMTQEQKDAFRASVESAGGTVIVEGDHFHVQFPDQE